MDPLAVSREGERDEASQRPVRSTMIADLVYAVTWVFDVSFAAWVVARLWEAAGDDSAEGRAGAGAPSAG
jgi:hypothetical protein